MNKASIGTTNDGRQITIDFSTTHTLLIAGGSLMSRNQVLQNIINQFNCSAIIYTISTTVIPVISNDSYKEVSIGEYDFVSTWEETIGKNNTDKTVLCIINDYADYLLSEGIVSKKVKSKFRKDVMSLAQKARTMNICLILVCGRPCIDVLPVCLMHRFNNRIALKTKNRVDSYAILDMPTASTIQEHQFVYSDGENFTIVNFD